MKANFVVQIMVIALLIFSVIPCNSNNIRVFRSNDVLKSIETSDCDYNAFFKQIINYIKDPSKTILQPNECFKFYEYAEPEVFEFSDTEKYNKRLSFYCQYGNSGTVNGDSCFGMLFENFNNFLKTNGFTIKEKGDNSQRGWRKVIYQASKKKSNFLFVYESESAGSMGYAKISILK